MDKGKSATVLFTGEQLDKGQVNPDFWGEVHRRLEAARQAIERGFSPAPGEKKKILRARAKTLAREPDSGGTTGPCLEAVEFLLSDEKYAIESTYVREVCPLKELTPLPCTPPFVLGIINLRGQILSVLDIRKFFGLPEKGLTNLNKVIVLHAGEMELGVLADAVTGTRSIPLKEIQPSLPTLTGIRAEYLRGVTNGRLVVLDAAKVLADKKIIVCEEVEA